MNDHRYNVPFMSEKWAALVLILRASYLSFGNDSSHKYTMIGILQSFAFTSVAMVDPYSILGFSMYLTGIVHCRLSSDVEPKLAKASAWAFKFCGTCWTAHSSK